MEYREFLQRKEHITNNSGFDPVFMPDFLFDFQKSLVEWSIKKGRSAIFADCGLGKSPIELVWAKNVVRKTNGNVLLLTPLAVSSQMIRESEKFGIEATRSRNGKPSSKITITNYEQLEKFNHNDFIGIICDESSAIKDFKGKTKTNVTRFATKIPYRLLATATPSPNDFIELGTTSEALGELQYMDMLAQFFRDTSNDKNPQWSTPKYELKGHAIKDFWRWVSGWARAIKKPSDMGFNDDKFILPELITEEHVLKCTKPPPGKLFVEKARTLTEQRTERKSTLIQRSEKVLKLCEQHERSVIWAHYNYETDYLKKLIPDSVNISGADSDDQKEEKFNAFINCKIKRLIIKPSIGAWGLNWQHCNHMTFFPSHSYEQYYQGVRRCWRFGQKKTVYVDIITTEGEQGVSDNLRRKSIAADNMFSMLVRFMNNELTINKTESFNKSLEVPKWL